MKRALAWAMLAALIGVTGVCPFLTASQPAPDSCCPHSKPHRAPCSESAATNCPYVLLEKAKSERGLVTGNLVAVVSVTPANTLVRVDVRIGPRDREDASDSYLFFRILRL